MDLILLIQNFSSIKSLKFKFISILLVIPLSLILFSCNQEEKNKELPIIILDSTKAGFEISIKEWQILGPFPDDTTRFTQSDLSTENPGLFCDYLKDFRLSEGCIEASDIVSISKSKSTHVEQLTNEFTNRSVNDTNRYFYFSNIFKRKENTTCYAFCEIYSPKEQDVLFVAGMDDGMIAWLNNKVIISKAKMGGILEYQYMVVAHLNKGKNLFYAKVYNIHYDWGMFINIYSLTAAKDILSKNNSLKILDNWIYHTGDSLNFNIALFASPSQKCKLIISDHLKNIVLIKNEKEKRILNINMFQFKKGVYSAKICTDTINYEQSFYYGNDADSLLPGYISKSRQYKDEKTKINLNALIIRYKHLIDPENKKLEDPTWQSKLVFVIQELEDVFNDLEHRKDAFKHKIGKHLRGFLSEIDNQEQFYKIYIPHKYGNGSKPLPVVVFVPFETAPTRPFLKSFHVANLNIEQEQIQASEKYGCILLWINSRGGYSLENPIETTDYFEVLKAVREDYNIDENRIYLTGMCSGGLSSLTLGMRYPSLFAAIGIFSPITHLNKVAKSFLPIQNETADVWFEQNTPLRFTGNYLNLPIYILHGNKSEVPEKQSLEFVDNCRKNNVNPYFKITYDDKNPEITSTDYTVFDFFKEKQRNSNPKIIDFSTTQLKYNRAYWVTIERLISFSEKAKIRAEYEQNNTIKVETRNIAKISIQLTDLGINRTRPVKVIANGKTVFNQLAKNNSISVDITPETSDYDLYKNHDIEGPVMHAFSKGFILADCENSIISGKDKMSAPCDSIYCAWKRDYFVEGCRYKKAAQINQEDINKLNLVLIGNPENNSLIKNVITNIPLKFYADSIVLCGKVYKGRDLGIEMIYPNPLNRRKYIVMVGSNNWENFTIPQTNLSTEGWYDFVIFEKASDQLWNIIDVGYFDNNWQHLISLVN
ncbi:MAG: prolyl oligopeptidase family serine peptidase [Bacteroidetes bacterium]|nr:prolyl oligopeptidase family serine peptidase [Bacteroidota bacterium]